MITSGRLGVMERELIAAGRRPGGTKPPFYFRALSTGSVFELRSPEPPGLLHWDKLPLMIQAQRYLEQGVLAREDYERIARWHSAWHRRLARWLVHKLQPFC